MKRLFELIYLGITMKIGFNHVKYYAARLGVLVVSVYIALFAAEVVLWRMQPKQYMREMYRGLYEIKNGRVALKPGFYGRFDDGIAHGEIRAEVAKALHDVPEPYQTALILRDLEEMAYDEIAEVLQISLGTVKSRITRGRQALRVRLSKYVQEVGPELGLTAPDEKQQKVPQGSRDGREVEVTP